MQKDAANLSTIDNFFNLKPFPFKNAYITIGNFDGVHLGHRAIVEQMTQNARPNHQPVVVVTFYPNPADYFNPDLGSFYLSTPREKEIKLKRFGVNEVVTFRFNRNFAELSPMSFLKGLKEKLGLGVLVVGCDFALGKNRQGTLPVIQEIGRELSFEVESINPVNFGDQDISSTKIRQYLHEGNVTEAARMLGGFYTISGAVTHGSDRGSKIGLPTANIAHWSRKKLPAVGVYATYVYYHGQKYLGITNVGCRPTFEVQAMPNIETHILDFDGNIYGEELKLKFVQKIRNEQKFSGVEAFLDQIARDKIAARKIFSHDEA